MGPQEIKTVLEVWPRVKPGKKLILLEELDALAEVDTIVSFDDFARALLKDPEPMCGRAPSVCWMNTRT